VLAAFALVAGLALLRKKPAEAPVAHAAPPETGIVLTGSVASDVVLDYDAGTAAKVYRPRALRNLKNDQQYRVGRVDLDEDGNALVKSADVHAIQKRSNYGEGLRHQSWIAYEFQTLEILFEAGVDVPKPYALEKNAILMVSNCTLL
jgi:serine/threonine-protein kinase RIO1